VQQRDTNLFLRISVAAVIWLLIWAPWHYRGGELAWRGFAAALIVLLCGSFLWWWSASKPDDEGDDCPLKLGARRFLIIYLIVFGILLIAAITFLSWFDFTPVNAKLEALKPTEVNQILKPAAYGLMRTPWGVWWISLNVELLLLAILSGALGSYIHAVKSLADFLGNRTAKTSWFYFYVTRPFLGAALALLFYAVVRGGFMAGTPADAAAVSPYGVIAICGLVGMFSDRASQKLSEIFETLFRTNDTRKDKLASADPSRLDPDTIPVGGHVREITVRGANLGSTDRVRIDGLDRQPNSVSNDTVVFTLTEGEVAARKQISIQLVGRAGETSKRLTLYVSDLAVTVAALPDATIGQQYGPVMLAANGGSGGYSWTATGLPRGVALEQGGQNLTGQPAANTQGTAQVTLTVKDSEGARASITLPLTVH
jgi:hypothetical protein